MQLYSPLLPNLLRRLRAATRGLPYPRLECFDVEERPGRRDRRIRARAGPLQVKRVVCVRQLVMALHKRRGLQGGLFGWVSMGSLRMFKMYGRMSWSIKRLRSVVSEVFDTFWFCLGRIQGVLELLESVTSAVQIQDRWPHRAKLKWFHGVLEITGEVQ